MSHFIVSLIVWAKSQDSVHEPQFLKRKESRSGSNRGPSIYQHSALPLGHTGLLSFGGWGVSFTNSVLKSARSFVGWGVSLTRPMLESVSLFGAWGVCLTRPMLVVCWARSLPHSPCLESGRSFGGWRVSLTALCLNLIVGLGVSLTRPMLESVWSLVVSGVSVTRPILKSVSSFSYRHHDGISHFVRWVGSTFYKPLTKIFLVIIRRVGSFSYTPRIGICLAVWRVGSLFYTPSDGICLFIQRAVGLTYKPCAGVCHVDRLLGRLCYMSG